MGLFSAGDIDVAGAQAEYQAWLIDGERVLAAFRTVRDTALLTNLRFVFVDVQGLTGSKKEFLSIPWRSVTRFSFETAGTFALDADMKMWVRSEEHTSELQSLMRLSYAVFCLKKKNRQIIH